jgi:hypothetical protein
MLAAKTFCDWKKNLRATKEEVIIKQVNYENS